MTLKFASVIFFLCTFAPAKLNHGVLAHLARFFFLLFPGIRCRYFFALHFLHFLHFPLHSANSANSAVHFFLSLIASECYSDIFLLRRARDESLVIPWRYLGGSLDVTLPNTYPKSRQTKSDCDFTLQSLDVEKRRLERPTPTSRT